MPLKSVGGDEKARGLGLALFSLLPVVALGRLLARLLPRKASAL